ncbi:MAG TPA: methylated-DNA--[protein]-cysteine S-methyltransferase [Bacillota bacterium]|nr:methylated-DNA--[protein]-cysteine S-methyltransferase [Bacillota bacterium]HPT86632.1 methylated-DNA--[protein]-cysteine S-methyltransferase [Bacillota bacterium]
MFLTRFETPWGWGYLGWNEKGVTALHLPGTIQMDVLDDKFPKDPFDAVIQLRYYFEKKLTMFSIPLVYQGTGFQQNVWEKLLQIPYGETWSYRRLAETIGCPGSARAVGNALHRNPIPIIIPCHRVIRESGSLGGYAGGLSLKKALLGLEAETTNNLRR